MTGPVFEFRYGHFGNVRRYGIAWVIALALSTYYGVVEFGESLLRAMVIPLGLVLLSIAAYLATHLFPNALFGKRLVVSSEGVRIWRTELPAERIVEVVSVDAESMWEWIGGRFKGIFKLRFQTKGGKVAGGGSEGGLVPVLLPVA